MSAAVVRKRRVVIARPEWARPNRGPDDAVALTFPALEDPLLRAAISDARLCGWAAYHTHGARHSESGFPDLVAVRTERAPYWGPPFMLLAELKGRTGVLSPAQIAWGMVLRAVEAATGGMVVYRTWWPWDRPAMAEFFAGVQKESR